MPDGSAVAPAPETIHAQPHLIDSILPAYECSIICGPSGSGKTTFTFQQLMAFAQGQSILGQPSHPCTYAYLSCDLSDATIRETCRRVGMNPQELPYISYVENALPNDIHGIIQDVRMRFYPNRPSLLIIDAIAVLLGSRNHNDYGTVAMFLRDLTRACHRERVTILGLTHSSKVKAGEDYANPRQRILGSAAWAAFCSTIINIEPEDPREPRNTSRRITIMPRNSQPLVQTWQFDTDGRLFCPEAGMEGLQMDQWLATQPVGSVVSSADMKRHAILTCGMSKAGFYRWMDSAALRATGKRGLYEVIPPVTN